MARQAQRLKAAAVLVHLEDQVVHVEEARNPQAPRLARQAPCLGKGRHAVEDDQAVELQRVAACGVVAPVEHGRVDAGALQHGGLLVDPVALACGHREFRDDEHPAAQVRVAVARERLLPGPRGLRRRQALCQRLHRQPRGASGGLAQQRRARAQDTIAVPLVGIAAPGAGGQPAGTQCPVTLHQRPSHARMDAGQLGALCRHGGVQPIDHGLRAREMRGQHLHLFLEAVDGGLAAAQFAAAVVRLHAQGAGLSLEVFLRVGRILQTLGQRLVLRRRMRERALQFVGLALRGQPRAQGEEGESQRVRLVVGKPGQAACRGRRLATDAKHAQPVAMRELEDRVALAHRRPGLAVAPGHAVGLGPVDEHDARAAQLRQPAGQRVAQADAGVAGIDVKQVDAAVRKGAGRFSVRRFAQPREMAVERIVVGAQRGKPARGRRRVRLAQHQAVAARRHAAPRNRFAARAEHGPVARSQLDEHPRPQHVDQPHGERQVRQAVPAGGQVRGRGEADRMVHRIQ
jgi:hypothetical protein